MNAADALIPREQPAVRTPGGRPPADLPGRRARRRGQKTKLRPVPAEELAAGRPLRILIADDHPIVREGLKRIVAGERDMRVEGEAADSEEALKLAASKDWDVIVLDLAMPGRGGLEVLTLLKRERPDLPVLVLSVHPEDQLALRVLKAGASGYLNKEAAGDELASAIRRVVGGGKYVSQTLAEKLAFGLSMGSVRPLAELLSEREYEVLCLLASGKTVGEIAGGLARSVKTVSTIRTRLLRKLRLRSTADLIRFALQHGLVE